MNPRCANCADTGYEDYAGFCMDLCACTAPKRIPFSGGKGGRRQDNTVSVARPDPLGDPFVVGTDCAANR
jgi:hypothetical protein